MGIAFLVVCSFEHLALAQEEPQQEQQPPTEESAAPPAAAAPPAPPTAAPTQTPTPSASTEQAPQTSYRLPIRFAERPLTLPRGILSVHSEFGAATATASFSTTTASGTALGLGAQVGVIDNLTLRFVPVVARLSPDASYQGGSAGGTFRFTRGLVDFGASLDMRYHAEDPSGVTVAVGLPVLFHFGEYVRLDTGLQFQSIHRRVEARGFGLPVVLTLQPVERFFLGGGGAISGLGRSQRFPGTTTVGATGFMGVTVGSKEGPLVDLRPRVEWQRTSLDSSVLSVEVIAGYLDVVGHFAL